MNKSRINTMYKVVDFYMHDLRDFLKNHGLTLGVHRNAVKYLYELTEDKNCDLHAVIQRDLITPLSDKVNSKEYKSGSFIVVKYSGARIHFSETSPDTIYWIDSFSRKP